MSTSASTTEQKGTQPAATPETDVSAMEQSLRQAAQKMDRGEEVQDTDLHPVQSKDEAGKKPATETSGRKTDAELASDKKAADEKAAADAAKAKADKEAADKKAAEDKKDNNPESAYAKAKKEQERFDRNWKKFQEEQEQFKQRQAQLEQRERALAERERAGGERRAAGPLKDKDGFTADQYDKAATEWEKQGKFDLADAAKDAAKKLREQESRGERQPETAVAQPAGKPDETPGTKEFENVWNQNLVKLVNSKEYADLGNKESELFKQTAELLRANPRLSKFNDGILIAADLAKLRLEASSASALRTKIQEQDKELEKLRKATSPGGGDTAENRGETKSFDQLSSAEQEAALAKAAREADSG